MFGAAAAIIAEPVSTLPVKLTMPMRGEEARALPTDGPRPWTTLMSPGGRSASTSELAELDRVVWSLFAGLDHDGIAGDQRGGGLARNQEEGEIPGQNAANDADRLAEQEDGLARTVALQDLALDAARPFGHVVEVLRREGRFHACQGEGLALFLGDDSGQRFDVLADLGGDGSQDLGALDGGPPGPASLRCLGCSQCRFKVRAGALRNGADEPARGGVGHPDPVAARGSYELAIDEIVICLHHGLLMIHHRLVSRQEPTSPWSKLVMEGVNMPLERISIDPNICHGQACVKGTRIPVHQIVRMLANGDAVEDLLAEYPSLTREDIMSCLDYAADLAEEQVTPIQVASL